MLSETLKAQIYNNFGFTPTLGQKKTIESLAEWISHPVGGDIFILNGYAGTGKTTLIAALAHALKELKIKTILLAPTGRAAKVVGGYTGQTAYTIHKKIYRQKSSDPDSRFTLDHNKESGALFVVDEGSMLGDASGDRQFGSGSLLDDLVQYVRSGKGCRLIIVGDDAQLPPVGHDHSPALDARVMSRYGDVVRASLDDVVRQQAESGILFNATLVRAMLENNIMERPLFRTDFPDVVRIGGGAELAEEIETCYSRYGRDQTIVITRSNKRAVGYNTSVRQRILGAEGEIDAGDMLMVVKNNYSLLQPEPGAASPPTDENEFIANGDIAQLRRIRKFQDLYGFRFAEASLTFPDYGDREVEGLVLLDTLNSETPSLPYADAQRLYNNIAADFPEIKNRSKLYKAIIATPHYNALQIKFAYAVTCHKAQGGQWRAVFIDRLWLGDAPMSRDTLRWLYTALTRATERLYLVNFDDDFFE